MLMPAGVARTVGNACARPGEQRQSHVGRREGGGGAQAVVVVVVVVACWSLTGGWAAGGRGRRQGRAAGGERRARGLALPVEGVLPAGVGARRRC
jgi:hypothetical protein